MCRGGAALVRDLCREGLWWDLEPAEQEDGEYGPANHGYGEPEEGVQEQSRKYPGDGRIGHDSPVNLQLEKVPED